MEKNPLKKKQYTTKTDHCHQPQVVNRLCMEPVKSAELAMKSPGQHCFVDVLAHVHGFLKRNTDARCRPVPVNCKNNGGEDESEAHS